MALGDPYATTAELKARMDISDSIDDTRLSQALAAASREIETWCGRQFNTAGAASARVFYPTTCESVDVDDFSTTAGLVIATDENGDGTFERTWSAADYQLEPLNGIVDGQTGWPYHRISAVGFFLFPTWRVSRTQRRASVQVTAQWGWAAVPAEVKEACLILAAEVFKLGDAPFGVAGFGDFGPVRVRMNTRAQSLLAPYRLYSVLVA